MEPDHLVCSTFPSVCEACHRTRHSSELDLKPTLTWWLRLIRLYRGQVAMLSYAERKGYKFNRWECGQCFGPGYDPRRFRDKPVWDP